jgi:hypothetical protein
MPGGARQQAERVRPAPRLRGALIQYIPIQQYPAKVLEDGCQQHQTHRTVG